MKFFVIATVAFFATHSFGGRIKIERENRTKGNRTGAGGNMSEVNTTSDSLLNFTVAPSMTTSAPITSSIAPPTTERSEAPTTSVPTTTFAPPTTPRPRMATTSAAPVKIAPQKSPAPTQAPFTPPPTTTPTPVSISTPVSSSRTTIRPPLNRWGNFVVPNPSIKYKKARNNNEVEWQTYLSTEAPISAKPSLSSQTTPKPLPNPIPDQSNSGIGWQLFFLFLSLGAGIAMLACIVAAKLGARPPAILARIPGIDMLDCQQGNEREGRDNNEQNVVVEVEQEEEFHTPNLGYVDAELVAVEDEQETALDPSPFGLGSSSARPSQARGRVIKSVKAGNITYNLREPAGNQPKSSVSVSRSSTIENLRLMAEENEALDNQLDELGRSLEEYIERQSIQPIRPKQKSSRRQPDNRTSPVTLRPRNANKK